MKLSPFLAVGPDDPIQQLLGDGVDPALLVDGADDEAGAVFIEAVIVAHPVHLGGGGEDDALVVLHAIADDLEVLLEVELEHAQRVAGVLDGGGDGHQRQDHVALLDVILDPLGVDADVPFHEVEVGVTDETVHRAGADVEAIDLVAAILEQALGQVVADEAVDAEDQHPGQPRLAQGIARLGADLHSFDQPQFAGQLGAAHIESAFGLTGHYLQHPFTAGDAQRLLAQDGARLLVALLGQPVALPHRQLAIAGEAEGARVGLGDGAHQVVQFAGRAVPVQFAIGRGAAAIVAGLALILRGEADVAGAQLGQLLLQQRPGGEAHLPCRVSAVSSSAMATACWATMAPASGLAVIWCRVMPVSASPLTRHQLMGARPR